MDKNKEVSMFPLAPEIKTCLNYDKFKIIEWNRSVSILNVNKLVTENRKEFQLHKFPILVTSEMEIVDGQHRFFASKEMGCPIYYIMDEKTDKSIESVSSVNRVGRRHSKSDRLEMLFRSGDDGAKKVFKIFSMYNGIFDKVTIFSVLCAPYDSGSVGETIIKNGKILLSNYEKGIEVLDSLYYSNMPSKNKGRMVYALSVVSSKSGIHPKAIIKRCESNMSKWVEPKSREDNELSLQRCYNYGLREDNRIFIKKLGRNV